jgi:hypothetical protein
LLMRHRANVNARSARGPGLGSGPGPGLARAARRGTCACAGLAGAALGLGNMGPGRGEGVAVRHPRPSTFCGKKGHSFEPPPFVPPAPSSVTVPALAPAPATPLPERAGSRLEGSKLETAAPKAQLVQQGLFFMCKVVPNSSVSHELFGSGSSGCEFHSLGSGPLRPLVPY